VSEVEESVSQEAVEAYVAAHLSEVRAFYDANGRRYAGAQYRLRRIQIAVPAVPEPDHEWEPVRWSQMTERLYTNNEPFESVAMELSVDPLYAEAGGDMGWVFADDLPSDVREMVQTMRVGELRRHDSPSMLTMYKVESFRTGPRDFEEVSSSIGRMLLLHARAAESGGAGLPSRLPVLQGHPRPMAEPGPQSSGTGEALTWTWGVGDGRVTLWRTGWERTGRTPPLTDWRRWLESGTHAVGRGLWQVVKLDEPKLEINPLMLVAVLFVYLLVIGPVDYFVLRRLKRLEWTVFTYSGSILVFSLLAWAAMYLSQSQESRLVRVQVASLYLPEALVGRQLDGQEVSWQGSVQGRWLYGYFTSTRERLTARAPDPSDAIWSPPLDEFLAGALLDTQTLAGRPPVLTVEAAAYAMLPIERGGFRTWTSEPPLTIEPEGQAALPFGGTGSVVRVHNRTDQPLRQCVLVHEDGFSMEPFAVPALGEARVERLEPLQEGRTVDYAMGYSEDWTVFRAVLGEGQALRPYGSGHGLLVCVLEHQVLENDEIDVTAEQTLQRTVLRLVY